MRSMTGYASVENRGVDRDVTVEIRSVNNRYLELFVSLPSYLAGLEPEIKSIVRDAAARGKVEITVRLREHAEDLVVRVDARAVEAARDALHEIGRIAGTGGTPTVQDILGFDGIIQTERRHDVDRSRDEVVLCLRDALVQWNETRSREGEATGSDIQQQLRRVRECATVFADHSAETETQILNTVRDKFRDVLGDEVDEQRVYAEAAALIVKHATNEEIVRLRTHLDAFDELITVDRPIGKRLDFICQEMNREINTTGSKTVLAVVQAAVVEAKDAVEAIREQIRNIE